MVPSCVALIGYICIITHAFPMIGTETSISIFSGGLNASVEVRSGGWTVKYWTFTDFRGLLNPTAMERACVDNTCVEYHRKCDNPSRPKSCDFTIKGPIPTDAVHIGEDDVAFASALQRLEFVVRETGVLVPFSAMIS